MKILDFYKHYHTEEDCKMEFKRYREQIGVVCPHCGCTKHYYISKRGGMFQCSKCHYRQGLRANTLLHGSKLSFLVWFQTIHLLTTTSHSFSAVEIQRQLGLKRYQPVWEMVHKIREAMGKRDGEYTLKGGVEIDEGFFSTENKDKCGVLKRGVGSQAKTKVLVMAESEYVEPENRPKYQTKTKKVGHIKMMVINNLKSTTIQPLVCKNVEHSSDIVSDKYKSHIGLEKVFHSYSGQVIKPEDLSKVLPWVHIAIANSKSQLRDLYHGVKPEYLQNYLNEFVYKFNRRYYRNELFEQLLKVSVGYKNSFEHRRYDEKNMKIVA